MLVLKTLFLSVEMVFKQFLIMGMGWGGQHYVHVWSSECVAVYFLLFSSNGLVYKNRRNYHFLVSKNIFFSLKVYLV